MIKAMVDIMENFTHLTEKQLISEQIYDGHVLHVYKDIVKLPNDREAIREVIRHVGAVGIIPITDEGEVIVEYQYRYPIDQVITEIPAGKLDSKTENRLDAAKRELLEETGITADEWIDLGIYYPAAAYTDELITIYLAKGLHFGEQNLDDDEFLDIKSVPLEVLVDAVMKGEITDGKTQVAVLKIARMLGK